MRKKTEIPPLLLPARDSICITCVIKLGSNLVVLAWTCSQSLWYGIFPVSQFNRERRHTHTYIYIQRYILLIEIKSLRWVYIHFFPLLSEGGTSMPSYLNVSVLRSNSFFFIWNKKCRYWHFKFIVTTVFSMGPCFCLEKRKKNTTLIFNYILFCDIE